MDPWPVPGRFQRRSRDQATRNLKAAGVLQKTLGLKSRCATPMSGQETERCSAKACAAHGLQPPRRGAGMSIIHMPSCQSISSRPQPTRVRPGKREICTAPPGTPRDHHVGTGGVPSLRQGFLAQQIGTPCHGCQAMRQARQGRFKRRAKDRARGPKNALATAGAQKSACHKVICKPGFRVWGNAFALSLQTRRLSGTSSKFGGTPRGMAAAASGVVLGGGVPANGFHLMKIPAPAGRYCGPGHRSKCDGPANRFLGCPWAKPPNAVQPPA